MRLTELATLAGMTKQSVGEIVDDLVDLGYVERIPDPADSRAKLICLTEQRRTRPSASASASSPRSSSAGPSATAPTASTGLRELLEEIAAAEAPTAVPELSHAALAGSRGE